MTEDEMVAFALKSSPDLSIRKVQTNSSGWDNDILILNEEIVFRFPKSDALLSKIEDEGKILAILKGKNPILPIPAYEYLNRNNKLIGVKYSFLKGRSLNELPNAKIRENPLNAQRIGDFLTKLHRINLSELSHSNLGFTHSLKYWENLYTNVQNNIFPFIAPEQQQEVRKVFNGFLEKFQGLTYRKTLIHGDLTASNILYSQEKECIDGIIDFTDAQIGDPAFDFAGLYWAFGSDFTEDVLQSYGGDESKERLLERVRSFYGLQPVFHELLYAIKNKQEINWETAFDRFSALNGLAD